jgi:hypothetical protein
MNKQDPKFIKDGMTTYVNKVSSHHYATSRNANRIIFYPVFKGDYCIMIKATISVEGEVSIDTQTNRHRKGFRESLFLNNKDNEHHISIKRHKTYDNLFDGVKEYIDEQDEPILNYTFRIKVKDDLTKMLNK